MCLPPTATTVLYISDILVYAWLHYHSMCRDFCVALLSQKLSQLDFSNLQDMFIIIKAYLGNFFATFEKQDGHHRRFFGWSRIFLQNLWLVFIYVRVNLFYG